MEAIVRFGPDQRLVGLLTSEPGVSQNSQPSPALVLFNAGTFPRSGPFRLYVELARRLAHAGTPVFRFDLPGVGESPRLSGCSEREAIREALDCLEQRFGFSSFVIGGVCSAADHGWRVACRDPRVSGVLMLDGMSYEGPWYWVGRLTEMVNRGPSQWLAALQRLAGRIGKRESGPRDSDFRDWPTRKEARIQLAELLARDVRILFIYTGGAATHFRHPRQHAWALGSPARGRNVELHFWPGCDHLFYLHAWRQRLLGTVTEWLQRP